MPFEIGQKVICVDASVPAHLNPETFKREFPNWVKQDVKYTIRDVFYNDNIVTSVVLVELRNPILYFPNTIGRHQEASFRATRFRELDVNEETEELVETEGFVFTEEFNKIFKEVA